MSASISLVEAGWREAGFPLLLTLQLLPLAGALLLPALRRLPRVALLGLAFFAGELVLALWLYFLYDDSTAALQFGERLRLFGPFAYHAGVDGVSVLFILVTALLSLLAAIYGLVRGLAPGWRFLSVVLAVEAATMTLFTSLDLFWFVFFSVLQLGLVGYLLWRWGTSPDKELALRRFQQFMGLGVLLLLSAALLLGWSHAHQHGYWSFDLFDLATTSMDPAFSSPVFFLLFYGLAIRTPIFPLHGWLPVVAEHGNIAVGPTLLLGIKVGIYGMVRFLLPLLPEAALQWQKHVVAFAVLGIFYAAALALMQHNLRRLLAFAVVSHTGLIIIGLFALETLAFQGAVLLSVNFGLAIATLLFMTGMIYRRTRTTSLRKLGGLFDTIPFVGITFLVAGLAIVGMPGTPGFDAAHLVLEASIHAFGGLLTIAAALGNVLAAGFLLWAFQRAFLAPRPEGLPPLQVAPTSLAERLVAGAVAVVLLGAGFWSEPWLELIEQPLQALGELYRQVGEAHG